MDKRTQILLIGIAAVLSSAAMADDIRSPSADKPATRIDFNTMIDSGETDAQSMEKSVANKMDVEKSDEDNNEVEKTEPTKAEQKKVMDFVDVEVGVGPDRPVVVDRRYNSVGEPRIATEFSNPTPKSDGGD